MKTMIKRNQKGFTVVELMVVVGIATILVSVGIPSMQTMIQNNRISAQARAVVTALHYARSEAVTRKDSVNVVPTDGNSWANGMTVWVDTDGDGSMDNNDTEVLQVYEALNNSTLTPSATVTQITYEDDGSLSAPTSAFNFTLNLSECKVDGRTLSLSQNGRVSIAAVACS